MSEDDVCAGCEHLISLHFPDVRGVARCTNVDSGTSSSGIIGLPWTSRCDCKDYVSEQSNIRKAREAEKDREWNERIGELVKAAREQLSPTEGE